MGDSTRSELSGAESILCEFTQACGVKELEVTIPKDPFKNAQSPEGVILNMEMGEKARQNGGSVTVPIVGTGNPVLDATIESVTGKPYNTGLGIKFKLE